MRGNVGRNNEKCPRAAFVELWKDGQMYTLPTICKQWECVSCQKKVRKRIMDKIEYGCSMAGPSWFITATFRRESSTLVDAPYVAKVWARFLKMWRLKHPQLQWMKIIETTKKGQPHLHMVARNIGTETCRPDYNAAYLRRDCDCVLHQVSQCWRYATNYKSWIVDVRPVVNARGAAAYLGKYLVKQTVSHDKLLALGFHRRWSRSRDWPVPPEEALANQDWDMVYIRRPQVGEDNAKYNLRCEESEGKELMKRVDQAAYLEKVQQAKDYQIKKVGEQIEALWRTRLASNSTSQHGQGSSRLPNTNRR